MLILSVLLVFNKILFDISQLELKIEQELFPISSKLEILFQYNIDFLEVIKVSANESTGYLKHILNQILKYNSLGKSIPESLALISKAYSSTQIKQFLNAINIAYQNKEYGALSSISKNSSLYMKTLFERTGGILSNLIIAYVVFSSIAALFSFILLIIAPFFNIPISFEKAVLIFSLLYPFFLFIFSQIINFFSQNSDIYSSANIQKLDPKDPLLLSSLFLSFFLLLFFNPPFSFMSFFIPGIYLFIKKKRTIDEKQVVDFLFYAAGLSQSLSLESLIKKISKENFGKISDFFSGLNKKIKAGMSAKEVLASDTRLNIQNPLLKRAILIIWSSYKYGNYDGSILSKTAENIAEFFMLLKKRSASFSSQKYTLIFSAIFLIPAILSMTISLQNKFSDLNFSDVEKIQALSFDQTMLLTSIFFVFFSFFTSYLLSILDSNQSFFNILKNFFLLLSIQSAVFSAMTLFF